MRVPCLVLLAATGLASLASAQMGAEEFDALTRGQTFYYGVNGSEPYGAEEYLDNRRVRWSFLDGECVEEPLVLRHRSKEPVLTKDCTLVIRLVALNVSQIDTRIKL